MTKSTNENKCVLAGRCKVAGGPTCNNRCEHFIHLHGHSGKGGRIEQASAPVDYRLLTMENSPAREGQPEIYAKLEGYVKSFADQFDEDKRIKSLYLWSASPGNGKTSTAAALMNQFIAAHYVEALRRDRQPAQKPAYFLDVNETQSLYNEFTRQGIPEEVRQKASREFYRRLESAKKAMFTVCDDIGVRQATDGFRSDLHGVINYRTANSLPTVYTSNLPITEMAQVFDERLYDRMRDQCAVIHFGGESKRGKR